MLRIFTLIACLALTILMACRGDEPKRMPDTIPEITGTITTLTQTDATKQNIQLQIIVTATDKEIGQYPQASIKVVDGELFSWYGSRLAKAPAYLQQVVEEVKKSGLRGRGGAGRLAAPWRYPDGRGEPAEEWQYPAAPESRPTVPLPDERSCPRRCRKPGRQWRGPRPCHPRLGAHRHSRRAQG